jgi:hypothetical protein
LNAVLGGRFDIFMALPVDVVVADGPRVYDGLAVLTEENRWLDIGGPCLNGAVTSTAYLTAKEYNDVAGG